MTDGRGDWLGKKKTVLASGLGLPPSLGVLGELNCAALRCTTLHCTAAAFLQDMHPSLSAHAVLFFFGIFCDKKRVVFPLDCYFW